MGKVSFSVGSTEFLSPAGDTLFVSYNPSFWSSSKVLEYNEGDGIIKGLSALSMEEIRDLYNELSRLYREEWSLEETPIILIGFWSDFKEIYFKNFKSGSEIEYWKDVRDA